MSMSPHLSPHVDAGALVFLSGQLGFDADGRVHGDVAAQTRVALARLEAALAEAGLVLADVVKTTVWLRDGADFAAFNAAYAQAFGEHRPARSTVVCALVIAEARVEIEAVALRKAPR